MWRKEKLDAQHGITHRLVRADHLIPPGLHQATKVALCTTNQAKICPKSKSGSQRGYSEIMHDYSHN